MTQRATSRKFVFEPEPAPVCVHCGELATRTVGLSEWEGSNGRVARVTFNTCDRCARAALRMVNGRGERITLDWWRR